MYVPHSVADSAAIADLAGYPPIVAAANLELCANQVTPAGLTMITETFAEGHCLEPFGGSVGEVWAAYHSPLVDPSEVVADWAVGVIATHRPPSDVLAAAGGLRPTLMRRWDKKAGDVFDRLHSTIHTILVLALERTSRSAGVGVMAWVKDPGLRHELQRVPLNRVAHVADSVLLTKSNRSVWQTAAVDINRIVNKEVEVVESETAVAVDEAEAELRVATRDLFDVNEVTGIDRAAIIAAVAALYRETAGRVAATAVRRLRGAVTRILNPSGVPLQQTILKEAVRRIPVGATGKLGEMKEALTSQRLRVTFITNWVHGYYGVSTQPFPPHLRLDGAVVGSATWNDAAYAPYEYVRKSDGTAVSINPTDGIGWFPGDHYGCRCGYASTSILSPTQAATPES